MSHELKAAYCLSALGMVNALGDEPALILERLFQGDLSAMSATQEIISGKKIWVGAVADQLPEIPEPLADFRSRNTALILAAFTQIKSAVDEALSKYGPQRVGVVLGSSTSGIAEGEKALAAFFSEGRLPPGYRYQQQQLGSAAEVLARAAGADGLAYTVSTACSSSAQALASARNLLALDLCDAVIVGGADSLCQLTLSGFNSLNLLSSEISNPMSQNRCGINIGEGACLMLLQRGDSGVQLLGIGSSCDAYHMSAPDPSGEGARLAMERSLEDAKLAPSDIAYINLHGTGTQRNDAMESKALYHIFSQDTPCSSTKPLVGHLLGAAGATEIGFCWLMLTAQHSAKGHALRLLPHCWDGHKDPELPELHLTTKGEEADLKSANQKGWLACLSNSFAFGGNNCSVIIGTRA